MIACEVELLPDPVRTAVTEITENRALWIEPGYLVLLKWTRAEDDTPGVEVV